MAYSVGGRGLGFTGTPNDAILPLSMLRDSGMGVQYELAEEASTFQTLAYENVRCLEAFGGLVRDGDFEAQVDSGSQQFLSAYRCRRQYHKLDQKASSGGASDTRAEQI